MKEKETKKLKLNHKAKTIHEALLISEERMGIIMKIMVKAMDRTSSFSELFEEILNDPEIRPEEAMVIAFETGLNYGGRTNKKSIELSSSSPIPEDLKEQLGSALHDVIQNNQGKSDVEMIELINETVRRVSGGAVSVLVIPPSKILKIPIPKNPILIQSKNN